MTAVRPPANWYADPTGRHAARYWDGFTWTPHVADHGTAGVDPLVRTTPVTAGAPAGAPDEALGPGTTALRAMADAAAARTTSDPAPTGPAPRPVPTRARAYDVAAGVAMIVVIVLGGYALWAGMLRTGSDGPSPGTTVRWHHDAYRLDLPPSWVDDTVPGATATGIDGAFQVIDSQGVLAFVGDIPEGLGQISTPDQVLAWITGSPVAAPNPSDVVPTVTESKVLTEGDRFIGIVVAEVDVGGGEILRSVHHLVVTRNGSVVIVLWGQAAGVDRHRSDALAAARSVVVR